MTDKSVMVALALEDAEAVIEEVMERQGISDEECDAEELCGDEWCSAVGCLADKLARVRAARAPERT